jgi:gluconolactonase
MKRREFLGESVISGLSLAGMRLSSVRLAIPVSLLACLAAFAASSSNARREPSIIRIDPEFDSVISRDAHIETIWSGFGFTEGPVWVSAGKYLLFSDIPRNHVMKWSAQTGLSLFLKDSGYSGPEPGREGSNGLALDPEGRLILCEHGNRCISRLERDGSRAMLADRYQGRRLNSPNDAVVRSNGDVYFTDPPFGLPFKEKDPQKELSFAGVYRLSRKGALTLLVSDLCSPNGIAFSPDERVVYISVSNASHPVLMKYPVQPNGTFGRGEVFYDMTSEARKYPGLPDGMKVDDRGNLFATGPGGVYVISDSGKLLGRIDPGQTAANCAWGEDGSTLYITASTRLMRVRTRTKGARWK